ncbi:MAG: glycosyltransferase family 9 protein [Ignavibacteria bacterium]|nr:glycosyltransferase family 9 protein [Ignavibacteria bacterium]
MKEIEIFFKNVFLKLLLLFNRPSRKRALPVIDKNTKVLFIRLNRIGDALVTTPLLKFIKDNCNCSIGVLAGRKNFFVFKNTSSNSPILLFHKGLSGFIKTVSIINKNKYDIIVDTHDDVSATVSFLIALSKAPYKFGLKKDNETIFTHTVSKLNPSENHVINRIIELSRLFSLSPPEKANIDFVLRKEAADYAHRFIEENKLKRFKVGINISAGSDARFWGTERFKNLASFFEQYNVDVIILTAVNDIEKANDIAINKYPLFFNENFEKFCSLIPELDFLFTPDTSIVHIASAFNVPMFGIYVKYNTEDLIWYPAASEYETVITTEPNFDNLEFEQVFPKLKTFFEKIYYEKTNSRL